LLLQEALEESYKVGLTSFNHAYIIHSTKRLLEANVASSLHLHLTVPWTFSLEPHVHRLLLVVPGSRRGGCRDGVDDPNKNKNKFQNNAVAIIVFMENQKNEDKPSLRK